MSKSIDSTAIEARIRLGESALRFTHSVSVALTNIRLSHMFGETLDDTKLYACGLLHDICREWSDDQLYGYLQTHKEISLEREEERLSCLLHAPVAASILHEEGYEEEITLAIRWHTLGSVEMGRMGLVLFVSDYLEPLRKHITDRERGDLLNHKSLEEVALAILAMQDAYFKKKGKESAKSTNALESWLRGGKRIR